MDQNAVLVEFARSCKAAARAVSLYPGTHPAIQSTLGRVAAAADRLTAEGGVTLGVLPDDLTIAGESAERPDPAIAELASLLHERLVGELRVDKGADMEDWRALLLILARAPGEVIAAGGIGQAWTATGRTHFEIREIDYAEVLRERGGGTDGSTDSSSAGWDRIIAYCLQGDYASLDGSALASLFEVPGDPTQCVALLDRLERGPAASGATMTARAAALLNLVSAAVDAAGDTGVDGAAGQGAAREQILHTVAQAGARLSPDMLLALLAHRQSGDPGHAQLASGVLERMSDGTISSFVANSVVEARAATQRLAFAFQALVPDVPRREPLLTAAHDEARRSALGAEPGFEHLWQGAARMLTSYSDLKYVSDAYARELSVARTQAIEVDRVSDDPPERMQAWLASVSDVAIRELDLELLLDLARVESSPPEWTAITAIVRSEIEHRTLTGDLAGAHRLIDSVVREAGPDGRPALKAAADTAVDTLVSGPFVHHVVLHLRRAEDAPGVERLTTICHLIGPRMARPLAEALVVEEHTRAIRDLRELLLSFGAAGRQSVEQLKHSPNPAVRRTAIDLLRVFGGSDALPELASMLDDADSQVQRESIRAIVQIGTNDAYAVLERALVAGSASRDNLVQQLIGLRDEKAVPLLCYVLDHTRPRGRLVQVHLEIIDALGGLGPHRETARTLETALYRGEWWAPRRTAALRRAAAAALRRIASPDAMAVLTTAAADGGRGVRSAVQGYAGAATRGDRSVRPQPDPEKRR
jgi:hypothetical protein